MKIGITDAVGGVGRAEKAPDKAPRGGVAPGNNGPRRASTPLPADSGEPQAQVTIVPLTLPKANALVSTLHRHHAPIPGGFGWFCVGAVVEGELIGSAIAGRPTNRNNDDGQTVEVLRVATDGTPNAPSALLGACARAAKAVGAARIITYTLDSESGISLRGAGWRREADGIESWWTHPGKNGDGRVPAVDRPHMGERKVRWGLAFRDPVPYLTPEAPCADAEPDLFSDGVA